MAYQITLKPRDGAVVIVVRSPLEALRIVRRHAPAEAAEVSIETLDGQALTLADLESRALTDAEQDFASA